MEDVSDEQAIDYSLVDQVGRMVAGFKPFDGESYEGLSRRIINTVRATPPVTGEVGELVERLRAAAKVGAESCNIVAQKLANGYEEAAAMLERYAAENARLRKLVDGAPNDPNSVHGVDHWAGH